MKSCMSLSSITLICFLQLSLVLGQTTWVAESDVFAQRMGSHVLACDINNDSFPDLVSSGLTLVMVWMGLPGGLSSSTPNYTLTVLAAPIMFTDGLGLECADVNNDGYQDVIVGNWSGTIGNLAVYNGSSTGLQTTPYTLSYPTASVWYGLGIAAADYNNDGKVDVAVGAYGQGRVVVHTQGTSGLLPYMSPSSLYTNSISYGMNLDACDLSGDGYPELLVGCRLCASTNGTLYIVNNVGGTFTSNAQVWTGPGLNGTYGTVAKCGDFNGDGLKDVAILAQGERTLYVHYGTGNVLTLSSVPSVSINLVDTCRSLAVGDINNDGYDDIIGGCISANQIKLYYGGPSLVTNVPASFTYTGPGSQSGFSVTALPNLDGTGSSEFGFGTFLYTNGNNNEGAVTVVYNIPPSPSPTPSPSRSPSRTPSPSGSPSPSLIPSASPTVSPSYSVTPSPYPSPSVTPSVTPSAYPSPSATASPAPACTTPSSNPAAYCNTFCSAFCNGFCYAFPPN